MSPKPSFSIDLPRGFPYTFPDSKTPRTPLPNMQEIEDVVEPPPPPKQVFKVRRRKANNVPRDIFANVEEDTLPTFEMTMPDVETSMDSDGEFVPGYLAPAASRLPLLSPPKTPVDQITDYTFDHKPADWHMFRREPLDRPESACSSWTTSSTSSVDSIGIRLTGIEGIMGTSPESVSNDPFACSDSVPVLSPDIHSSSPSAKRAKKSSYVQWTAEMDKHLWKTYLRYANDPELTPFKKLPGTAPPLGVCGRVAREAKLSWKGPKPSSLEQAIGDGQDTIRPANAKTWSHWPTSEAASRKRLRKLCKRQDSMPAHYQRLISQRSPSPFMSSSPQPESDAQPSSIMDHAGEVREQPNLSSQPFNYTPQPAAKDLTSAFDRLEALPRPLPRHQAHQKSQSLQIALGRSGFHSELASPFVGNRTTGYRAAPSLANAYTHSLGRHLNGPPSIEPSLKSPLELHAPLPTNRSLKRRFGILDESPANLNRLENLFNQTAAGADSPQASVPARDRAFSLGAVYDSSRNLSMTFERLGGLDEQMTGAPVESSASGLQPPAEDLTRLGSPFTAPANRGQFNTYPRRLTPLGSELPHPPHNFHPNFSLEGRFRELAAQAARRQ